MKPILVLQSSDDWQIKFGMVGNHKHKPIHFDWSTACVRKSTNMETLQDFHIIKENK